MWGGERQKRADACDVVVVGAGLVGAAVAARLVQEGIDTAVLEAQSIASGATGRCTGMVLSGLAGNYKWAVDAYGRQKAREVWRLTVEGRKRLIEAADQLGVPTAPSPSLALATDESEAMEFEESATLLREDGFEVQFLPNDPLERGFHAALHYPGTVTVDAATLTRALLTTNKVSVHERTEVLDVEPEQDGVRIWAQGRTVFCHTVILTINGYAYLFHPYFREKVSPVRALALATEPLDQAILEQPCSADSGYTYCRQLSDRRLLLSSWRRPRSPRWLAGRGQEVNQEGETEPDDAVQNELLRFASRYFPDIEWHDADRGSGVMGLTPDGLPLVGQLPEMGQVHFAVGFGGRGLAWAFVVAERLTKLVLYDTTWETMELLKANPSATVSEE